VNTLAMTWSVPGAKHGQSLELSPGAATMQRRNAAKALGILLAAMLYAAAESTFAGAKTRSCRT